MAGDDSETESLDLAEYTDSELDKLGNTGRFQWQSTALFCLPKVFIGMQTLVHLFTAMPVERRRVCLAEMGSCDSAPLLDGDCQVPRSEYEFSHPWLSIVAEFNLVCEDALYVPLLGSTFFFGFMFGVTVWSTLADSRGRRLGWLCSLLALETGSLVAALAPSYGWYAVARFMAGVGVGGLGLCTFLWNAELLGQQMRSVVVVASNVAFAVGVMLLSPLSYSMQTWRSLSALLFAGGLPLFGIRLLVPESPRWLAAKGEAALLHRVLCLAAATNGRPAPQPPNLKQISRRPSRDKANVGAAQSLRQLLMDPRLRRRFLVMCFTWISVTLGYYGISMSAVHLGGSIYTTSALAALMEVPAYFTVLFTVESAWVGRRGSTGAGLVVGGLCCVLSLAVAGPEGEGAETVVLLAFAGKFSVSLAMASIYLFAAELFPTDIRARAMGLQSLSARLGAMVAPLVAGLGSRAPALPLVCFGLPCILAGLLQTGLPETRGRPLQSSVEELPPPEGWPCGEHCRCRYRAYRALGRHHHLEIEVPSESPAPERLGKARVVAD